MLRVWIGGWRHVEHLDPTKAHTGIHSLLAGEQSHNIRILLLNDGKSRQSALVWTQTLSDGSVFKLSNVYEIANVYLELAESAKSFL